MRLISRIGIIAFLAAVIGCASSGSGKFYRPETDDHAVDGDADTDAAMYYSKPEPDHRNDKSWEFFYKHCEIDDAGTPFVSKRTYACTDAF